LALAPAIPSLSPHLIPIPVSIRLFLFLVISYLKESAVQVLCCYLKGFSIIITFR